MHRLRIPALAFICGLLTTGIAGATTITYTFQVPVSFESSVPQGALAGATVTCSVGGQSLGYSSGANAAQHECGHGTTAFGPQGQPPQSSIVFTADVPTQLVQRGAPMSQVFPATNYVCWMTPPAVKASSMGSTPYPVAFVQGTVTYAAFATQPRPRHSSRRMVPRPPERRPGPRSRPERAGRQRPANDAPGDARLAANRNRARDLAFDRNRRRVPAGHADKPARQ
jgi:hypothetical protein